MKQYLLAIASSILLFGGTVGTAIDAQTTTYARGQDVSPTFDGWQQSPDGTYTFYFGYFNRNTEEVRSAQRDSDYMYRLAVDPPAAKELRLFGLVGWTIERFIARRTRMFELQYRATRLRERPVLWSLLLVLGANLIVFWSLANAGASGSLGLGQLVVYAQVAVGTSMIAFGVAPHAIGKDHPEGIIGGVHSNYYFNYPPGDRWPLNTIFVKKYVERWKEYPNFQSEGAYTALYLLKTAIERANKLAGGWPDDEAIISQLEGLSMAGPAGYIHIRPDNHQAYKDAITGFSVNSPDYPFQILDPNRMITIPIRNITAPPGWPKGEPTSTYTWIEQTWPKVSG